jgi:hypothetical protein
LQRTLTRYTGLEAGEPDWQFMPLVSSDAIYGSRSANFAWLYFFSKRRLPAYRDFV